MEKFEYKELAALSLLLRTGLVVLLARNAHQQREPQTALAATVRDIENLMSEAAVDIDPKAWRIARDELHSLRDAALSLMDDW